MGEGECGGGGRMRGVRDAREGVWVSAGEEEGCAG